MLNTFSGEKAVQVESEFKGFLAELSKHKIEKYLEVGVARGDTFHEVSLRSRTSLAIAVDLPESMWGLSDSQIQLERAADNLRTGGCKTQIYYGPSTSCEIIEKVFSHAPFDLVFIDGDHTYAGVKADWQNYGKMGRLVAFHDIANHGRPNRRGEVIEVSRFWDEIKTGRKHLEFIAPGSEMGIGLLWNE